jgi:hypothetical protein
MQSLPIYLYPNTYSLILDLDETTLGVNRVMYQHDLKLQRGVRNSVRIQFKNSDQKRITVATSGTYMFNMFDIASKQLVTQKPLEIVDDGVTTSTRGLAVLNLLESDTINLPKSSYNFSVTYHNPTDNSVNPTYANTYYGMTGVAYLGNDAYPELKPSQEVISFLKVLNTDTSLFEHKSGDIYSYPELASGGAVHTFAVYLTGYRGKLLVEGTLSNQPNNSSYTTIKTLTYTGFTGADSQNFEGVYTYVRFVFIPSVKPGDSTNDDPTYYGKFDKVLYRS